MDQSGHFQGKSVCEQCDIKSNKGAKNEGKMKEKKKFWDYCECGRIWA